MTNELQIFCSLPKCEKDAYTECIDCEYMVREEPKKMMTNEEAREVLSKINIAVGFGATPILSESQILEATSRGINAIEQISHLKGRPCEACEFYTEEGCSKWECVFDGSESE